MQYIFTPGNICRRKRIAGERFHDPGQKAAKEYAHEYHGKLFSTGKMAAGIVL